MLGLFVYTIVVRADGPFFRAGRRASRSRLIVLPVVVRTTDEMLQLVPAAMREAALVARRAAVEDDDAGAVPLGRCPASSPACCSALARISGETAPLLFTALNNQYWSTDLTKPMASVPVVIFQYAMSPYDSWHSLAWAGAFMVTMFVLLLSPGLARLILRNKVPNDGTDTGVRGC